jgi:hypothetical protein
MINPNNNAGLAAMNANVPSTPAQAARTLVVPGAPRKVGFHVQDVDDDDIENIAVWVPAQPLLFSHAVPQQPQHEVARKLFNNWP